MFVAWIININSRSGRNIKIGKHGWCNSKGVQGDNKDCAQEEYVEYFAKDGNGLKGIQGWTYNARE